MRSIAVIQFELSIAAALRRSMTPLHHAIPRLYDVVPVLHPAVAPRPVLPARKLPRLALVVAPDPLYPLRLHGIRLAPARVRPAVVTVSVAHGFLYTMADPVALLTPH